MKANCVALQAILCKSVLQKYRAPNDTQGASQLMKSSGFKHGPHLHVPFRTENKDGRGSWGEERRGGGLPRFDKVQSS